MMEMHRFWLSGTFAEVEHVSTLLKRDLICSLKSRSTWRSCGGLSSLQEINKMELREVLNASRAVESATVVGSGRTLNMVLEHSYRCSVQQQNCMDRT
jgi:hypothetical protein